MRVLGLTLSKNLKALGSRYSKYDYAILISMVAYAITFSYFTCLKHYTFSSYAWDLGIFNQALYSTLHGKVFYYTVESYVNVEGSYFAIHFSPILFLLIPFYAISPRPETLLILQSCILALGALPLYLLAREVMKDKRSALLTGLVYFLHPAIHGANWFDFHPQAFYPFLMFSMYYFFIRKRWILYTLFTFLTLMVMEWSAFMVILLAANLLLMEFGFNFYKSLKGKEISTLIRCFIAKRERVVLTSTALLGVAWWYFASYLQGLFPLNPTFKHVIRAISAWRILFGTERGDFQPLLLIPQYVLMYPQRAFDALLFDYHIKFLYIMLLLGPLLFIPLRSRLFLSYIILLIPCLLANDRVLYMIGNQHPLHIIPFIFLAFVDGFKSINGRKLERPLIVATLLLITSTSPASPMSHAFLGETQLLWYPKSRLTVDEVVRLGHQLIDLIPANASVLATNSLFPHVSSRLNVYAIPLFHTLDEAIADYVSKLIDRSDFVLLRIGEYGKGAGLYVLEKVSNDPSFGLYAVSNEIVLFKRGYKGEPVDLSSRIFTAYQGLVLGKNALRIKAPELAVFYPASMGEGIVVYGPYIALPPGTYKVTFTIMVAERVEGHVATLEVTNNYGREVLAKRHVYGFELVPEEWSNVSITFHSPRLLTSTEFRVFASGFADLYVREVTVERLPSLEIFNTFNYKDLSWKGNTTVNKGLLLHPRNFKDDVFWYGPYIKLPPGRYEVRFYLKVVPSPKEGEKVVTLDVVSGMREGPGLVLLKVDVDKAKMKDLGLGWYEVLLTFETEAELRDVEFRGINPSPNYDIYLAYVSLAVRPRGKD